METTPGKRILIWREYKGLTPAQMIKATGIKRSTLDSVEDPNGSKPSHDTLMRVVDAFPDLNARWLLTGKGEMLNGPELTRIEQEEDYEGPSSFTAETNPDEYYHRYQALLDMVKTGFFGSPEQLLKGTGKKVFASSGAATLFELVDTIHAETSERLFVTGFQQAGVVRQLA